MDRSVSSSIAFVSPLPIVHKWGALRLPGGSGALVTGVDIDGFKHVLGIWLASSEGARFWGGVLAELRNRGLKDVLFVCCDGLGGLPEAIEAAWPKAIVQTCVIHLVRASMKYVSWHAPVRVRVSKKSQASRASA